MRSTFSRQSLARQVLFVLALVSLLYLLVAVVILRSSLFASFVGLEQELVREDARRVREALDAEVEELLRLNNEWSQWDDTYRYLRDGSPAYAETWLNAATLDSAEVDLMALLNPDGSPAWVLMRDDEGRRLDALALLEPLSRPDGPFSELREESDQVAGLVVGPRAPVLLSALAVLHSDGSGPPAGVLVMGRRLGKDLIGRLSERTGVDFDVHRATALPPAARPFWESLEDDPTALPKDYSPQAVISYQTVSDLWGDPVVLLEARTPRRVTAVGQETVATTLAMLMAALLLSMVLIWRLLHRRVVAPLRHLQAHVAALRSGGDLDRQSGLQRNDEIGDLAKAFDALTDQLSLSIEESETARATAETALRARSEFLARMSHEIRTPMNGVLGMANLLLETEEISAEQRNSVATIYESGRALLVIIDDILDLSKIESGKLRLVPEEVDVKMLTARCLDLLRPIARGKGLRLRLEMDDRLQPAYRVDGGRLRQILTNLVGNAIKFTESGSVTVSVAGAADGVCWSVRDTGIGIHPENLDKIFDSFVQEDSAHTRRFGGTGLGLAISRQLVTLMDGRIEAASTLGSGSCFSFTLPLAAVEQVHEAATVSPAAALAESIAGAGERRVLVAEDNRVNREVVRRMLQRLDCEVVMAENGEQAVERFRGECFDLVLMDCEMPGVDGYEATRRLRVHERLEAMAATPIVALTANVLPEDRDRCLAAGMDAVITKPVTLEILAGCLERHLAGNPER